MNLDTLQTLVPYLGVLIISLTVHEWGHAMSAWKLGDDTAARQGRLTLNPIAHIDPVGTLLIPALAILGGGMIPLFGWAKPVPVNAARFDRSVSLRAGGAITAVSGPAMNIALALAATIVYAATLVVSPELVLDPDRPLAQLLGLILAVNVNLAFFNLIPVPPLDGGWILQWALPTRLDWVVDWLAQRGMMILLLAVFGPRFLAGLLPLRGGLVPFLGPVDLVRVGLALAAGVATFVAWRIVAAANARGVARDGRGAAAVLEWSLPLALAFATAQVSITLSGLATQGLFGAAWSFARAVG